MKVVPETIEPPAQDDRWDDPVPETSPPVGGWDRELLTYDAMSVFGLSYGDAEDLLAEYSEGELRTLLDRRLVD